MSKLVEMEKLLSWLEREKGIKTLVLLRKLMREKDSSNSGEGGNFLSNVNAPILFAYRLRKSVRILS